MEDRRPGRSDRRPVVPNGSMGFRYAASGVGKWNLDLEGVTPGADAAATSSDDVGRGPAARLRRARRDRFGAAARGPGPPGRRAPGHHGLRPDARPVRRRHARACRASGRRGYDDAGTPYTPAWQAEITSVPAEACIRIAREFARNAEESGGRSMIIMGAGICQWFHGDATYRAILSLLILTGCMGRNGGGWAHYVGQEKCRPITGWISLANALDWSRPPRTMTGTSYWYMHTDQWRNDGYSADSLASPLAKGHLAGKHTADTIAQSARLGWMPFYPQFDRNPLDLADEATAAVEDGAGARRAVVRRRRPAGRAACVRRSRTSTHPANWPRTLVLWRSNLMGSSAKGNEYFLRNLLGTHSQRAGRARTPRRPGRPTSPGTTRRPRASSTCWSRPTSG